MSHAASATNVVRSPCVNLCRMDAKSGWCEGCFRSLDEIAAWGGMDAATRSAVHARIAQRRAAARETQSPDRPTPDTP
jgi:predicted Fe-S protein YdhL (DUF1289 family)